MMKPFRLYIYKLLSALIPETSCFTLKRALLHWAGAEIGENVKICSSATFLGAGKLTIGSNTWIGQQVLIVASGNIHIGENVDIAPLVYIGNGTHEIDFDGPRCAGKGLNRDISIGNGCWLCVRSTILPGVSIGSHCVVCAGALANKSFDDKVLIAGIPAEKKKLFYVYQ